MASQLPPVEGDFIERLRASDPAAWETVENDFLPIVRRCLLRRFKVNLGWMAVDDAAASARRTGYRRLTQDADAKLADITPSGFLGWLITVASNKCLAGGRKRGTTIRHRPAVERVVRNKEDLQLSPEQQRFEQEFDRLLDACRSCASANDAMEMFEAWMSNLSQYEIADKLGRGITSREVRKKMAKIVAEVHLKNPGDGESHESGGQA